ncbi:MAG: hypothetical protein UU77_C0048G0006 [candidate division WWE3 bacterium GW2011_GWC1_41_7]|uniref:Uncharacterized protein n=2 Tax=Katanobacteria TaxID=422282 RepID=A0A0G1A239_UNCKA|nr:MAG: hypothetical protein UU77_C0048G0006 [candidate division WWE3 bacterium GW2011_GWC1_41_7]OGC56746.1 MAG: hypothetical protein A2976_03560 [candidate division WWE3 bacterium RIFCSPLOWO2_01_FULL_41_9]
MKLDRLTREWLGLEEGKEYEDEFSYNPLETHYRRKYFISRSHGRIKNGPRKGEKRFRKHWREVELLERLPSGKHIAVKDHPVKRLDSDAEEVLHDQEIPAHLTPYQHFLNLFRKLPANSGKKNERGGKKTKRA